MDYFIASLSYGPKTASGFISPLSAECMLQYKKKAAAYMKALRKVGVLLLIVIHVLNLPFCILCGLVHHCMYVFFYFSFGTLEAFTDFQSAIPFW